MVSGFQFPDFLVGEHPRPGEEPNAQGYFERETAAPAGGHVQDQLGMLPVFKLVAVHIERATSYLTQQHITVAGLEFAGFKAHRLGTVAASAALVKHQRSVLLFKAFYQFKGLICGNNAICLHNGGFTSAQRGNSRL